jgi:quercetin dioxygenase-like cupin family protein
MIKQTPVAEGSMSRSEDQPVAASAPQPPVGVPAGNGTYVFELARVNHVEGGPDYSSATGSLVEGERSVMGLMRMPRGTGARPHSHPNEQWVYVIEGTLLVEVDGTKAEAGPGCLIYFPPNSVHATVATADRDVVFLTSKDRTHGLWGTPTDTSTHGPRYQPGFKPPATDG